MNEKTKRKISAALKGRPAHNRGKRMPQGFGATISLSLMGHRRELNRNWKGDEAKYTAKHVWIHRNYGKAHQCENALHNILNFSCTKLATTYHWAKKQGSNYSREIKDYVQLCRSCHFQYDQLNKHTS